LADSGKPLSGRAEGIGMLIVRIKASNETDFDRAWSRGIRSSLDRWSPQPDPLCAKGAFV